MQTIRTFISVDLPEQTAKEIQKAQSQLPQFKGKLTEPQNLHLTLKFLGEINHSTLDQVKQKLSQISLPEFEATLQNPGTFSKRKNPRIAWIKINGKQIAQLQKQIDEALTPLFPKEERFMSHLTIARIKHTDFPAEFIKKIKKIKVKPLSFPVKSFKLCSSELQPEGPIYKTIKEFSLTNL